MSTFADKGNNFSTTKRHREFLEYIDRRNKIIDKIDKVREKLQEIDLRFTVGDLSKVAYLRERNRLLMNPYQPARKRSSITLPPAQKDAAFLGLSSLDKRYFENQLPTQEYLEERRRLVDDYLMKLAEGAVGVLGDAFEEYQDEAASSPRLLDGWAEVDGVVDPRFSIQQLEKEPAQEEAAKKESGESGYQWTRDPGRVVFYQRVLFFLTVLFGYFFIISPGLNYYSRLNTVIYFTVIAAGLYSYHYRRSQPYPDYEPYVSVIIPVYNGESMIYDVVKQHLETDYPFDKLEVIIANDGSVDDTVDEIRRAIIDFPYVYIKHLNYPENGGKRAAIWRAFQESTGEVIVRGDADTFIDRGSLRKIVTPLQEPEIKGVTGRIYVKNEKTSHLTKIQKVRYNYAFQQLYPFQNLLGSLLCLPGCFSAYSRSAIEPFMKAWAETKPGLSEDRQLAHLLLENGHRTMFVKEAVCHTRVPEDLRGYIRQQLRWGKANFLQQLRATRFIYKKRPKIFLFYLVSYFISLTTPYAIIRLLIISPNWIRWLIIVSLASLGRGLVTEGLCLDAVYAVPLFFLHFLIDVVKMPLGMLTLSPED